MAVNVYNVKMGHSRVAQRFSVFDFKFFDIATFAECVDSQDLVRLKFVTFTTNDTYQTSFFTQIFHHMRAFCSNLFAMQTFKVKKQFKMKAINRYTQQNMVVHLEQRDYFFYMKFDD